jgi:hypothetical protein
MTGDDEHAAMIKRLRALPGFAAMRAEDEENADEALDLSALDWETRTYTLSDTPDRSVPHFPEEDFT